MNNQPFITPLYQHTQTLGTAPFTDNEVYIDASKGDLLGFNIIISGSATGTLTSPNDLSYFINQFILTANGNKVLNSGMDNIAMKDFTYLKAPKGFLPTFPNVSNSVQTVSFNMYYHIAAADLPATLQVTYNAYSALASGATGGSVTITVNPIQSTTAVSTDWFAIRGITAIVGNNNFQNQLPNQNNVYVTGFRLKTGSESDVTNINFSPDGQIGYYQNLLTTPFVQLDLDNNISGHNTNLINLYTSVYTASTIKTQLSMNFAAADNLYLYFIYKGS